MSSAPSAEEIARDATWLAQALDPATGVARLVAMDRDSYRAASFLDDRLLERPTDAQIIAWPVLQAAISGNLRTDARWIFHIGHVGSTLVSRLLGEIPLVLALREPRLLRDLALSPPAVRSGYIEAAAKLMSRTFGDDETACVKATSFVSEIAAQLVPPGERALFVYARPRQYIATILAGENSVGEMHRLAADRARRLGRRAIEFPEPSTDAERAAAAWACEMTSLEAAAEAMGDRRIDWVDFDAFLGDVATGLGRIAAFFGFAAEPERIRAIARGPLITRYSKALEYAYSPELREQLITAATQRHEADIEAALAMLESTAEKSAALTRALARSQPEI